MLQVFMDLMHGIHEWANERDVHVGTAPLKTP